MTTDADVELRLRDWLAHEAPAGAPASLRRRVLDIPAARPSPTGWWHRFASVPVVTGAVAAFTLVAMVLSGSFFTLFDRAPGIDGGLCNNRQLQRALDALRDTAGYRYVDTEQHQVLLSDPGSSLADPEFGWADSLVSRVAYLAPDRTHEVVTSLDEQRSRGFLEQVRIGNEQWQLREIDGEPTWIRDTPWPFGNWAWGYVQNAIGVLGAPGIASIRFGSEPVPTDLPGEGGCTIAAPGETELRIVALRIAEDGRVSHIYLGPPADAPGNRDAWRNLIAIDYTLPDAGEFVAPTEYIDEDEQYSEVSIPPQPTVGPLAPPEGGWEPRSVPLGDPDALSGGIVEIVKLGDGRWAAVGSVQTGTYAFQGRAWTSTDGAAWELVEAPPAFDGLWFGDLVWDGETLLAIGYRSAETEGGVPTGQPDRPESWLSTDGVTWRQGGQLAAGANPSRPVRTAFGWVAGGSIWSTIDAEDGIDVPDYLTQVQRPAFFSSPDGVTWATHQPDGIAYGSVSRPELDADGTLRAESCETPEPTNLAGGSPCFVREWTSSDGETWTAGPATEDTGDDDLPPVPAGDGFLAVAMDEESGEPRLVHSDDGTSWDPVPLPADGIWPGQVVEVPGGVVLIASSTSSSVVQSSIWRSTDGGATWSEIPLGVLPGSVGIQADRVLMTDAGLAVVGSLYVDETTPIPVIWVEP